MLNYVGYLMARFEYFQGQFAHEADQEWTKIELNEGAGGWVRVRVRMNCKNPRKEGIL